MLDYGWAILLGLVQGLTEFLPVSSSAHLALAERWGMGAPQPLAFDLALHTATLLVVIGAFARDFLRFVRTERWVLVWLVLGSAPAAAMGLGFKSMFEAQREQPFAIGINLLFTAGLLWLAESFAALRTKSGEATVALPALGWRRSLLIGCFQALALAPGISRSGATLAAGLIHRLDREDAVRFSFCLMVPAVGGATLLEALALSRQPWSEVTALLPPGPCLAGMATAMLAGWLALKWLFRTVRNGRLAWFSVYCAALGAAAMASAFVA